MRFRSVGLNKKVVEFDLSDGLVQLTTNRVYLMAIYGSPILLKDRVCRISGNAKYQEGDVVLVDGREGVVIMTRKGFVVDCYGELSRYADIMEFIRVDSDSLQYACTHPLCKPLLYYTRFGRRSIYALVYSPVVKRYFINAIEVEDMIPAKTNRKERRGTYVRNTSSPNRGHGKEASGRDSSDVVCM